MSAIKLASQRNSRDVGSARRLRERARQLLTSEINFVPNREFLTLGSENALPDPDEGRDDSSGESTEVRDLPAHLARMCVEPLLSAAAERQLFRRMNYLKFRANSLRVQLDPDCVDELLLDSAERLLREAAQLRDRIVQANMRLVMAVVKKFVTPQCGFDELLSDGIITLMQAVEKFDYARGFRFSTYAYRSIARNAYRYVTAQQRRRRRFHGDLDMAQEPMNTVLPLGLTESGWFVWQDRLADLLSRLDARERYIVQEHYGLGHLAKPRTLQSLAAELGVSKERVRQLEQRALRKLRGMVSDLQLDSQQEETA